MRPLAVRTHRATGARAQRVHSQPAWGVDSIHALCRNRRNRVYFAVDGAPHLEAGDAVVWFRPLLGASPSGLFLFAPTRCAACPCASGRTPRPSETKRIKA